MDKKFILFQLKKSKKLFLFEVLICLLIQPVYLKMNDVVIESGGIKYLFSSEFTFFIQAYLFSAAILYAFIIGRKYTQKKACDFYGSLPIKNEKLFVSDAVFGWIYIIIPVLFSTTVTGGGLLVYALYKT